MPNPNDHNLPSIDQVKKPLQTISVFFSHPNIPEEYPELKKINRTIAYNTFVESMFIPNCTAWIDQKLRIVPVYATNVPYSIYHNWVDDHTLNDVNQMVQELNAKPTFGTSIQKVLYINLRNGVISNLDDQTRDRLIIADLFKVPSIPVVFYVASDPSDDVPNADPLQVDKINSLFQTNLIFGDRIDQSGVYYFAPNRCNVIYDYSDEELQILNTMYTPSPEEIGKAMADQEFDKLQESIGALV